MGYLNNTSTVLDAVLTKKGRELLSRGEQAFNVTKFALSDDEVDYSIIKKYGRARYSFSTSNKC